MCCDVRWYVGGAGRLTGRFYRQGLREGQQQSTINSFIEGKEYGIQTGFQKFVLVGLVRGFVEQLEQQQQAQAGAQAGTAAGTAAGGNAPAQAKENVHLQQLKELVAQLKLSNDYGDVVSNDKIINKVRNKLRLLTNSSVEKGYKVEFSEFDDICKKLNGIATKPNSSTTTTESSLDSTRINEW